MLLLRNILFELGELLKVKGIKAFFKQHTVLDDHNFRTGRLNSFVTLQYIKLHICGSVSR